MVLRLYPTVLKSKFVQNGNEPRTRGEFCMAPLDIPEGSLEKRLQTQRTCEPVVLKGYPNNSLNVAVLGST
jgi:hypothetical protein